MVWVVRRTPRPASGSSCSSQLTGHPRNCHLPLPQAGDHAKPHQQHEEENLADTAGGYNFHNRLVTAKWVASCDTCQRITFQCAFQLIEISDTQCYKQSAFSIISTGSLPTIKKRRKPYGRRELRSVARDRPEGPVGEAVEESKETAQQTPRKEVRSMNPSWEKST